jgi:hypothetical protein
MSASELTLLPQHHAAATSDANAEQHAQRRAAWWHRLAPTCASPHCAHRGKLWPTRLSKSSGIYLDARWFCEPACLQSLLEYRVANLLSTFRAPKIKSHRLPLGLLLVEQAAITNSQLRDALRLQRESPSSRIGDFFLRTGAITEHQLTSALAQQWGCPVFPLDRQHAHLSWTFALPLAILESARAVPAHGSADTRTLHLAFADRLDHTLLYAIEQLLDCRTVACMAPQSAVSQILAQLRAAERPEISFDTVRDPRDITSIICSYAHELRAARIAVARVTAHIWVRFYRRDANRDLLFRILPDPCSSLNQPARVVCTNASSFPADNRKDGVSNAALSL